LAISADSPKTSSCIIGAILTDAEAAIRSTALRRPQYGCAVNEPANAADEAPNPARGDGPDPIAVMRERRFLVVLVLAAFVGVVASAAAFGFLELAHELQPWVYNDLPDAFGFATRPDWWPLPVLVIAGVLAALAINRLPGNGGHIPAAGLNPEPTQPIDLPGVILAALASIGFGVVLGPEAPLIAMGGALGFLIIRLIRRDAPPEVQQVIAACGTFAAVSFLFGSPVIAAVLMIEASGIGGSRMPLILIPGLLAAGVGSLVSVGLGSWTGVDNSNIAIGTITLPDFARPDLVDFLWTIPLAGVIALGIFLVFAIGRRVVPLAAARPYIALPVIGLVIGGLAIVFEQTTDHSIDNVLFSGQETISPLVAHAPAWTTGALVALIACKAIAYALSLGSFRGGPVFPALLLGTAVGLLVDGLPDFGTTPAVAVGIGAATAAALRLPLTAVVLATLLTAQPAVGAAPLVIVGVVVAYIVTLKLPAPSPSQPRPAS
jgi:H+/Cl- antiporter ClcA